jgi:hypothetical protein
MSSATPAGYGAREVSAIEELSNATSRTPEDTNELLPSRPAEPRATLPPQSTRLFAFVALAALTFCVLSLAHGTYLAVTDAWVAPLRLSPESREVIAVRTQAAREQEERARFQSELESATAEAQAIELGIERLRTLDANYSGLIRWSQSNRSDQVAALRRQAGLLAQQQMLMTEAIARDQAALDRGQRNLDSGMITAVDFDQIRTNLLKTQVTRSEKVLEEARVRDSLAEASREALALTAATDSPASAGARGPSVASPDVVRFDEVRIQLELQIARLEAEKRSAESRKRAAQASIGSMDELRADLESTPVFLAAEREVDLAFVPYAHLKVVHEGDPVVRCAWFLFGCAEVGRVARIFPGEVVNDDPWGSVERGKHVQLEMSDRAAVSERTLRVRRRAVVWPSVQRALVSSLSARP